MTSINDPQQQRKIDQRCSQDPLLFCSARTKRRNNENAKILGGGVVFGLCRIFTAITKSHPQYSDVIKSDLDKCLPSLQDVQSAFVKVRQICVVGEPLGIK